MKIGVVGLGAMGLGIAQVFAQAGHEVTATDASDHARASAPERLSSALEQRVAKGSMSIFDRDAIVGRLKVVPELNTLGSSALVIEAIVESLAAKEALFALLETLVSKDAILATNTSSLSVTAIAGSMERPERLLGLHFFNPAPVMKLVELVAHPGTAPEALAFARALAEGAGKTVISCPDRPGFIVNRCARPFYGEALALLEEGRTAAEIDAAMTGAGYRIGPFALIDLIGADINLAATEGLAAAMQNHPRYHVFASLRTQVARGDLGRKTGKGFVHPSNLAPPPEDAAAIARRVECALLNEAAWLLSEGGISADAIDTAMQLGLNFPRGPFAALDRYGREGVLSTLTDLEAAAPSHLRGRYVPAPELVTS